MNRWPDEHHGPVTVYMANCGKSCKNFDGKGKVWFKIDEAGFYNATSVINQTWATNVLIANNLSWTVRIPDQIKAGEYLIRLELQALQTQGAPQFYPSCTQLNITSNGTDIPASNELASIPGIYKAKDVTMVCIEHRHIQYISADLTRRHMGRKLQYLANRRTASSSYGCEF
jgi:hypothetical protein